MVEKRNQPCLCGSGKRYKKCCGLKRETLVISDDSGLQEKSNRILSATDYFQLGETSLSQRRLEEAARYFHQAITLKPDFAEAYNNLGRTLNDLGKLDEAIANFHQAIRLNPDFAEAHTNLGVTFFNQGKLNKALASYRRALTLNPDFVEAHSKLLMCLNYIPNLPISHYLAEARNYGNRAANRASLRFSNWTCSFKPERLCVGLVSGDFYNHPVGYFLENMLANIDQTRIALVAYPTLKKEDELTARIRSCCVEWKSLVGKSDEEAAKLIHEDGVHVLLDLSGHTSHNRLPVFAWKPAPVQATWLGYFASTGLAEIDYLITDPISVPEYHQEYFTERVWYFPEIRFNFSPPVVGKELESTPLPAMHNGYITFGCFQNFSKINDEVLAVWGRILQELPQAKLRIQTWPLHSPTIREEFRQRLARSGIAPDSVTLAEHVPRSIYLEELTHIDIILDTFPFTGGTTTCEALWMGVPTVTLAGKAMVARQGASLLTCLGLDSWISVDKDDYVAKALTHSADLEKLARLRKELRRQMLTSPLCDSPRFAQNFTKAMWGMWHRFLAEQ